MTQTHSHFVPAGADAVAAAITSPQGLGSWLCNEARVEKRPGGRLLLDWSGGMRASGQWQTFEPPQNLAWRWQPHGGSIGEVAIALAPDGEGTHVTVTANGSPAEGQLARPDFWPRALESLAEYVATGRDLRLMQRPMLGVSPEFNPTEAGATIDTQPGILMGTPPDGSAAAKAGLVRGDRLHQIGDKVVSDWSHIGAVLDDYRAGDMVEVTVLRDGSPVVLAVTLGTRPQPELPDNAAAVMANLEAGLGRCMAEIHAAVDGLSEEQASMAPAEGDWTVKQVLGHLIAGERFGQMWLTYLDGDDTPADWPSSFGLAERHLTSLPLAELCAMLTGDLAFSAGITRAALDKSPLPPRFRQLAESAHGTIEHMDEHVSQIKAAAEAVRQG